MDWRQKWDVWGWLIPFGVVLIFFCRMLFGRDAFCGAADENCVREWVSALSGYVAAGAAAITIGSLFQQAKAAQKQTDFQLGDAEPTCDAVQHGEHRAAVVLQIRNWNRRSMIIRRIRLVTTRQVSTMHISFSPQKKKQPRPQLSPNWTFASSGTKKFEPALMIEGWVKRDEEPPLLKVSIAGFWATNDAIKDDWQETPVEVQYELVGIRRISRLTAHVHLASIAIAEEDALVDDEPSDSE